jgi:hypothetical protein
MGLGHARAFWRLKPAKGVKEILIDPDGEVFTNAWNIERLRRFYP